MIHVLIHFQTETLGTLENRLKEAGHSYREIHLYRGEALPSIEDVTGLIVMGGPMGVTEIDLYPYILEETQLIGSCIRKNLPVLGICLGGQLIAHALGSKVFPNRFKEVGWDLVSLTDEALSDPVFKGTKKDFLAFHWHGDTFDLPKGAIHLAKTSRCRNQAFRYGKTTYGFQFHLETNPEMIHQWIGSPEGKAMLESAGEDASKVWNQTSQGCSMMEPIADRIFSRYLRMAFPNNIVTGSPGHV
ncbi:hypothetical protein BVX98_00175 [bacterium F11]|nr:hypothetical protein BVX98_00175 [bacterium F11]